MTKNFGEINVIKTNGQKELFNADKIHKHIKDACEGLVGVIETEIITNAHIKIQNNIKSSELQDTLIKSAVELTSEEVPDYDIVAGRLLNQKLRKIVYGQYEPLPFKKVVRDRVNKQYYDSVYITDYTDEELDFYGSYIKYELDNELPYISMSQWYNEYLIKGPKGPIEVPQEVNMLIPMAIFSKEPNRKQLILSGYKLLSQRKISLPTPMMNGIRTIFKKFISCNLIDAGDSTKSLSKTADRILQCTASKSGIGINGSHIRGLGADIGNPPRVKHTGILPILKCFEASTSALTQVGRGGSANVYMPFYHYEIELFCQLGDSKGTIETRTRHLDQSIILNNWFLKKALNREDIYLFHPNAVPKLYNRLGIEDEFDEWYQKYAKIVPAKDKKKVNAWEILTLFLFERSITGRVYFTFADNLYKFRAFKTPIYTSNLCCEIILPHTPLDGSEGTPEIAACILSNMNLGYAEMEDIPEIANFLIRFLDNLIDYGDYDIKEVEYASKNRRALGIGISNLFGALAKNKLFYNTEDGRKYCHEIMESFYYHLLKASNELAKERGRCELFNDTVYSEGKFVFDRFPKNKWTNFELKQDWESLRESIKEYGLRNSTVCAIPPAGNSSVVSNSTAGVEPPRELMGVKTDTNNTFKKLVPWFRTRKNYYTTAWGDDFDNTEYFRLIANLSKFTDQSISLNQYSNALKNRNNQIELKDVLKEIITLTKLGTKTLYYQNFLSDNNKDGLNLDEKPKCGSGGCEV